MTDTKPNYFTCTLGEALEWNKAHYNVEVQATVQGVICRHSEFCNISEFVDFLARKYGQNLAIGCVIPQGNAHKTTEMIEELLSR